MSIIKNKDIYDSSQGDPFKPILDGLKILDKKVDETKTKMQGIEKSIAGNGEDTAKVKELISNISKLEAEITKLKTIEESRSKIEKQLAVQQQKYIDLQTKQAKELAKVKVENQNLNKSLTDSAKINSDTTNKVMKYRIELRNLKAVMLDEKTTVEDYNKALQRAAFITDELGDMQERIKGTAMDLEGVTGNVSKVTQGMAGAYEATQGAMALFGAESEDLQKTMVKIQASIALTNGLQGLEGTWKAMKNLGTQMMNFAPIQKTVTALQLLWNKAISANPIVAAIALIVALGSAIYGLTKIFEDDTEAIKRQNTATDGLVLSSKELKDEYQEQLDRVSLLKDEYDVLTGAMSESEFKIKQLTKTYNQEISTVLEQTREKVKQVGGFWGDFWKKVTNKAVITEDGKWTTSYALEVEKEKQKIKKDSDEIIKQRAIANYYEKKKIEKEQQIKDDADAKADAEKKQKEDEANFKKYKEQRKRQAEELIKIAEELGKKLAEKEKAFQDAMNARRKSMYGDENAKNEQTKAKTTTEIVNGELKNQHDFKMNLLEAQMQAQEDARQKDLQSAAEMEEKKKVILAETLLYASEQFAFLLTSGQLSFKEFGRFMIMTALDVAERMIQLSLVTIFAKEIEKKSFAGLVTAPLLMGLVKGMFAGIKNQIQSFATGTDYINGPGTSTSDSILANVSRGEGIAPEPINKQLNALGVGVTDKRLPSFVSKGLQTWKMEKLLSEIKQQNELTAFYLSNGKNIWQDESGKYVNIEDWRTGTLRKTLKK